MTSILTADQMREIEQTAMQNGVVKGLDLMELAGQGVIAAALETWPEIAQTAPDGVPRHAVVLCGPGNNGGDGFVIARLLSQRGWSVAVTLYGAPEVLPPDARINYDRWIEIGEVTVIGFDAPDSALPEIPEPFDLLVDGLFGTGLTRPFAGPFAALAKPEVQAGLKAQGTRRVAIDIPSGLCADSGRVLGTALPADLTVSFHRAKLGHVLGQGVALSGALAIADIGLDEIETVVPEGLVHEAAPMPLGKSTDGHKYSHGHALVLTGGFGTTGAARLAAQAALRVGAGLVTLGVPGTAQMEVACQITSEMMTRIDRAADLEARLDNPRLSALCLGPGMGRDRAQALVPAALAGLSDAPARGCVLDADALTAFEETPGALFAHLTPTCVLTPHHGEFRRLFPDIAETLATPAAKGPAYSKVDATRAAAARAGCVVLYKGADTVIAAPDGRCVLHAAVRDRAVPWLATAGAGDVLAGLICGLLARGVPAFEAAETAAWLHVEAARAFGSGLTSEDLPKMLPQVLRAMGRDAASS